MYKLVQNISFCFVCVCCCTAQNADLTQAIASMGTQNSPNVSKQPPFFDEWLINPNKTYVDQSVEMNGYFDNVEKMFKCEHIRDMSESERKAMFGYIVEKKGCARIKTPAIHYRCPPAWESLQEPDSYDPKTLTALYPLEPNEKSNAIYGISQTFWNYVKLKAYGGKKPKRGARWYHPYVIDQKDQKDQDFNCNLTVRSEASGDDEDDSDSDEDDANIEKDTDIVTTGKRANSDDDDTLMTGMMGSIGGNDYVDDERNEDSDSKLETDSKGKRKKKTTITQMWSQSSSDGDSDGNGQSNDSDDEDDSNASVSSTHSSSSLGYVRSGESTKHKHRNKMKQSELKRLRKEKGKEKGKGKGKRKGKGKGKDKAKAKATSKSKSNGSNDSNDGDDGDDSNDKKKNRKKKGKGTTSSKSKSKGKGKNSKKKKMTKKAQKKLDLKQKQKEQAERVKDIKSGPSNQKKAGVKFDITVVYGMFVVLLFLLCVSCTDRLIKVKKQFMIILVQLINMEMIHTLKNRVRMVRMDPNQSLSVVIPQETTIH